MKLKSFSVVWDRDTERRFRLIRDFIDNPKESILDIGEPNSMAKHLCEYFNFNIGYLSNTTSDLNYNIISSDSTPDKFKTIWCFDVIEHLMNPLLFLNNLRDFCFKTTRIYISYPLRPSWFWWRNHFHEYDKKRFRHLLNEAGYEIVKYKQKIKGKDWWFYFTGIRPFLRLTLGRDKIQLYELRIK